VDQHSQRERIVLELGRQVGRDEIGASLGVRDDHDFCRSGDAVDSDRAEDLSLGEAHVDVARTGDHVHPPDRLRPVRQRSDRLGSAKAIHGVDARDVSGSEDGVRDFAVRRWGRQHPLAHTGNASRYRCHQDSGRICGAAPGRI